LSIHEEEHDINLADHKKYWSLIFLPDICADFAFGSLAEKRLLG